MTSYAFPSAQKLQPRGSSDIPSPVPNLLAERKYQTESKLTQLKRREEGDNQGQKLFSLGTPLALAKALVATIGANGELGVKEGAMEELSLQKGQGTLKRGHAPRHPSEAPFCQELLVLVIDLPTLLREALDVLFESSGQRTAIFLPTVVEMIAPTDTQRLTEANLGSHSDSHPRRWVTASLNHSAASSRVILRAHWRERFHQARRSSPALFAAPLEYAARAVACFPSASRARPLRHNALAKEGSASRAFSASSSASWERPERSRANERFACAFTRSCIPSPAWSACSYRAQASA